MHLKTSFEIDNSDGKIVGLPSHHVDVTLFYNAERDGGEIYLEVMDVEVDVEIDSCNSKLHQMLLELAELYVERNYDELIEDLYSAEINGRYDYEMDRR